MTVIHRSVKRSEISFKGLDKLSGSRITSGVAQKLLLQLRQVRAATTLRQLPACLPPLKNADTLTPSGISVRPS